MDKAHGQQSRESARDPSSGCGPGGAVDADGAADVLAEALESLITVWGRAQEAFGTTVSPTQLRALTIISRTSGISLHGLAQEMGTVSSVASRLCDRMDSAGLVSRELDADNRRKVVLELTAEGEALMAAIRERRARDLTAALSAMSGPDRAALVTGILAFRHAAGHTQAENAGGRRAAGIPQAPSSRRFA
ncbi:MAG TPA: MarR family transcriptional regulator [Yinghuangia sp.]|uniref:MarR family winged helix-turn-helix transcriptional regulator n=1 Tax=Yinghuangia sp. YIM S10712 TaxID=3436930 RepID=UPI002BFF4B1C|nr:MarR family transcriptional regulator [Yinghuangia sp.]